MNQPQAALWPDRVKIWPQMGLAAMRANLGGAWRLFILAKTLDRAGSQSIPLDQLRAYAAYLKIGKKRFSRWLADARNNDLVRDVQRSNGDWWLVLASHPRAAAAVGCGRVEARRAEISVADLLSTGWRAIVWAAHIRLAQPNPQALVSRKTHEQITGVAQSTQRAYEGAAGVTRRPNYTIDTRPADHLAGVMEFENRPAPFKFWDKQTKSWVIAWRSPDSRDASSAADRAGRGRSKKVNKALKANQHENGLYYMQQALSFDAGLLGVRLFNRTQAELKATERKLTKLDLPPANQPAELYRHRHSGPRANFWDCLPYKL